MTDTSEYSKFLSNNTELSGSQVQGRALDPVPREFVVWAYRLFLDREPDNDAVADEMAQTMKNSWQVRKSFMESSEFQIKNNWAPSPKPAHLRKPLVVEDELPPEQLALMLAHIKETWSRLGDTEPYWSVLSAEQFKSDRIEFALAEFKESGRMEVEMQIRALERNGVDLDAIRTCLEYGCGVGRVTRWLAEKFKHVYGYDISASHLQLAKSYLDENGKGNVELRLISEVSELDRLPMVDFVYSMIVLQHNPPPVISIAIRKLLECLAPGGVAFFQVPTYREGYRFVSQEYLKRHVAASRGENHIEMHLLPQCRIFELIARSGCTPLEVLEDNWAGPGYVSHTFVVQRPAGSGDISDGEA